ncbi:MAG: bifunctional phosphoribosylaminoimidazolecarboxamide formyltransferase/IMP cyclohydrolase [Haliangiales bacterium]
MTTRRAILSVSDKRGLAEFARGLQELGVTLISTGGTARALREAGVPVTAVSEYTGAAEIFGGRVKTLHPKIHGGLLARVDNPDDAAEMATHGVEAIDLVVVNLYPFAATVAQADVTHAQAIENIDIGGPTMIRAAAKNHSRVAVIVDPSDYPAVLAELAAGDGTLSAQTRLALAHKAFAHTGAYDAAIGAYFATHSAAQAPADVPNAGDVSDSGAAAPTDAAEEPAFPAILRPTWRLEAQLRYGENPHQRAAFYSTAAPGLPQASRRPRLADAELLNGKALSYNNLLDVDAALACGLEFDEPCAVIVKHTNPCGVATHPSDLAAAYERARATDAMSSFGGIVALSREVDEATAALLRETFLECIIAPGFTADAAQLLRRKPNLRLLATGPWSRAPEDREWSLRSVAGGLLVQSADLHLDAIAQAKSVTKRAPSAAERAGLEFAWRVCKHVKSNAIVFASESSTLGIGAGQMSRVDAVHLAKHKATQALEGACVASDAFFPFRDGIDALAAAGATAVVQPGGSRRDDEVIAAADEHDIAMLFTGARHFRH